MARALWQVAWWVSELQMRFRRILVVFSLGLLVRALLPSDVVRHPGATTRASSSHPSDSDLPVWPAGQNTSAWIDVATSPSPVRL
jgi:hypothetical protein